MSFLPKTLLVIGAGAGVDINMPTGDKLAKSIRSGAKVRFDGWEQVEGDKGFVASIRRYVSNEQLNALIPAFHRIADGISTAESIDNFLDRFPGDEQLKLAGKLLIAHYILHAERGSMLRIDWDHRNADLGGRGLERTWLGQFSQMLFSLVQKPAVGQLAEKVAFINFNYDRCLERYLAHAIQVGYEMSSEAAHALVGRIEIIHPYGDLGPLPSLPTSPPQDRLPFGAPADSVNLLAVAGRLSTFTEEIGDADKLKRLRALVAEAKHVIFLGFAFHPQNMRVLTAPHDSHRTRHVYATGLGIQEQQREAVKHLVLRMMDTSVHRTSLDRISIEADDHASDANPCRDLLIANRLNLIEHAAT